ncbi:Ribokinase-like protein [Lentinula aff. lateritia]|uniref:Ribokinase-like protein n=1 Tax=Lentinula aff. lateritia TaxID=2804960 RepID=A0ACC1U147_9AGAR|nr:Ribokinase-like protein [Lentinula aff. lateritia]
MANSKTFVTLGMFIIDEFSYTDLEGKSTKASTFEPNLDAQIGGGGTYAAIGTRLWLPPEQVGMIVDKGYDFPSEIENKLKAYGDQMWLFRPQNQARTTRAMNIYKGDHRGFEYLTPRIRITPRDLTNTALERPRMLHFICSPLRASTIISEAEEMEGWNPLTIYEPIPDRCVPKELPALIRVLPSIDILSPNAEEALSLLSIPIMRPISKSLIEEAANRFIQLGVKDAVIIRSGELGAYVLRRKTGGKWVDAFWTEADASKIVDVTGAGNSFLGGLSAGLQIANGDVYEAVFYATVSASFVIEQSGLPEITSSGDKALTQWNNDSPWRRLEALKSRVRHG